MNIIITSLLFVLLPFSSSSCKNYKCPELYKLNPKTCLCDPAREVRFCRRMCLEDLVMTPFCECKKPAFCKAIPCPEGTVQDPSNCQCVPTRSIKPLPICSPVCPVGQIFDALNCKCRDFMVDCETTCPRTHRLTKNCKCRRKRPRACGIRSCKRWHVRDSRTCQCKERRGDVCEIACDLGWKVYPGRCECVREIRCPIKRCKPGFRKSKSQCRCVKRRNPL